MTGPVFSIEQLIRPAAGIYKDSSPAAITTGGKPGLNCNIHQAV
jgi:hypothetical protein